MFCWHGKRARVKFASLARSLLLPNKYGRKTERREEWEETEKKGVVGRGGKLRSSSRGHEPKLFSSHLFCPPRVHPSPPRPDRIQVIYSTFFYFYSKTKILVVLLGLVGVEKLVSVKDALSSRLARHGRKINILICLWF